MTAEKQIQDVTFEKEIWEGATENCVKKIRKLDSDLAHQKKLVQVLAEWVWERREYEDVSVSTVLAWAEDVVKQEAKT